MTLQTSIKFTTSKEETESTFRTVHYLGSKLRILDFIKNVVDEVDPDKSGVCDLFSGSGSVSQHLSSDRKVVSVDIQKYSTTICNALLNPMNDEFITNFVRKIKISEQLTENTSTFKPIIDFEESLLVDDIDLEIICDFVENSSIYSATNEIPKAASEKLQEVLKKTTIEIMDANNNSFLAMKYFGGLFFSFKQAMQIDTLRNEIIKSEDKYQNILLAALVSTASDIVNTVGKQFAQPIRPRDKAGKPKKGILKQIKKDRDLDVFEIYQKWLNKYSARKPSKFNHETLNIDYNEALEQLDDTIGVVYADPPYTRDHYSRFYHGLETLCLGDFPTVSKTNIGGVSRLSRGMYREDRHQSDFCIKSKAPSAFENMFKKISDRNLVLFLSYSPYDKSKGAHPRVVELDFLESLAAKYFKKVEVRSPGSFSHSKLNKTELHLESNTASEVLLVCRN